MPEQCPLCKQVGIEFYKSTLRHYHQCECCSGIFMSSRLIPSPQEEQARYEEHHNDVENLGYQKFVSPIVKAVRRDYTSDSIGLDFGAGTGPVISKLLNEKGYATALYDPFFHDDLAVLEQQYDYIVCCEVMEHFHHPYMEFKRLRELLKPEGKLYCMTDLYDASIDFDKWYYKNDQTHVFIYQKETIQWIKDRLNFSSGHIEGRLITFSR